MELARPPSVKRTAALLALFTEPALNRIGRLSTRGGIADWPLPGSGGYPYGVAIRADGEVWFTEFTGSRV